MSDLSQKFKTLNRIDLFFLIAGLIECFCLAFIGDSKLLILIGLTTIITAFIPIKEEKVKWNYFVSIWALVKYNPISFAAIMFFLGDLFSLSYNVLSPSYSNDVAIMIVSALFMVIGLASMVMGIILLIKTSRYLRLKQSA